MISGREGRRFTKLRERQRGVWVFPFLLASAAGLFRGHDGMAQEAAEIRLLPPDAIGPIQFTKVSSVRELGDGSVIVADYSEKRLALVGWGSDGEAEIGREGQGPGEFESIGALFPMAGDATLFTDPRLGRWSVLDGADFSETFAPDLLLSQLLGWRLAGTDDMGHVLGTTEAEITGGPRRPPGTADTLLLVLGELRSQRADTIARIKGVGEEGFQMFPAKGGRPRSVLGGNPLGAVDQALLFRDGWIALARVMPYRVDWRTSNGQWIQGPPLPFKEIRPSDSEKRVAMVRVFGTGDAFDPGEIKGWPETVPPFLTPLRLPTLVAAPDGCVLVGRTPTEPHSPNRYDVVDRDGRLIGFILLPPNQVLIGSGRESVFVLSTDEMDLQTLSRHPWPAGRGK